MNKELLEILNRPVQSLVKGDISHIHAQTMELYLKADPRVHLVIQTRDPLAYAESAMAWGRGGRSEVVTIF